MIPVFSWALVGLLSWSPPPAEAGDSGTQPPGSGSLIVPIVPSEADRVAEPSEPSVDAQVKPAAPVEPGEDEPGTVVEPSAPVQPLAAPDPNVDTNSPLTVVTRMTPDPSHIGDLLSFEIVVAFPSDHAVNMPAGLKLGDVEVVEVIEGEVESSGQGFRKTFTLKLQYFAVGEAEVPSFPITWVDPDGGVHTHRVAAHAFVVESLLANEADPERRPDDPLISLAYPNRTARWVMWGTLGGLALALIIWFAIRAIRRREQPIYAPPPIPAHEQALADLATLADERESLLGEGLFQDYYLRLSEIAKRYIQDRFGVEALERTTDEIRRDLARDGQRISPLSSDEVVRLLQDCDLVKFARFAPEGAQVDADFETVHGMVERSRPAQAAPPQADVEAGGEPAGDDPGARAVVVVAERPVAPDGVAPEPEPEPASAEQEVR